MKIYAIIMLLTVAFSATKAEAFLRDNDVMHDTETLSKLEMIVFSYKVKNGKLPESIDDSGTIDMNEVLYSTGISEKEIKTKLTGSVWKLVRCTKTGNKIVIDSKGSNVCGVIDQIDAKAVCKKNMSDNECRNVRGTVQNYFFVIKHD